ncbi:gas vesicle protein GvpG [Streptomyces sp. LX-29]|uniref:gas vesicle protein GvpG n=1 Tax=Streptomyces sp. LX-29 TaxID=2900152 RepID=UPI00240E67DE|nr:gas vesicle protein GvpG [Streptomyces sp. LX-29]WFB06123.1 gas vesicle protein GvpG [Streptomyces sp. LX-29]
MGVITQLLTLPLAPVRGAAWVMGRVVDAAEAKYYDPAPAEEELARLEKALLAGEIDEETFERREDELLNWLEEVRAYWRGAPPERESRWPP